MHVGETVRWLAEIPVVDAVDVLVVGGGTSRMSGRLGRGQERCIGHSPRRSDSAFRSWQVDQKWMARFDICRNGRFL